MNCQECRSLVERFLDHALTGFAKRKVNLHLSRCATCRAYFDRRSENQALAYHAMNAALAGERLPEGFAKRFRDAHIVPERRFRLFRFGRRWKAAAALAAMVTFIGFAAVVVGERLSATAETSPGSDDTAMVQEGTKATYGTEATAVSSADASLVASVPIVPSLSSTTSTKGENQMKRGKAAAAALTAAMAAAPLAAANGDEYQFIISGDPIAAAKIGSSSDSSATTALMSGPLADGFVYDTELEARYRTMDESATCALRSDKAGLIISFK